MRIHKINLDLFPATAGARTYGQGEAQETHPPISDIAPAMNKLSLSERSRVLIAVATGVPSGVVLEKEISSAEKAGERIPGGPRVLSGDQRVRVAPAASSDRVSG